MRDNAPKVVAVRGYLSSVTSVRPHYRAQRDSEVTMNTPNETPAGNGEITPKTKFTPIPAPDAVTTRPPAAKGDDDLMSQPVKPS